jgi:CheY-like chemotaxis protein
MTGFSQRSDRERSLTAGFDTHLVKPVDLPRLDKLLARVQRHAKKLRPR